MKVFMIDPNKCSGCHLCELACSFNKHSVFNRELSNIRIQTKEDILLHVPVKCMQCEESPCINACVAQALYKDESTGAILCDQNKCIGCKACVIACPFGCISVMRTAYKAEISLCDLCEGDPECVKACRQKALSYVDESKINREKRERTFTKVVNQ